MKINSNVFMALLLGLSFGANSHAAVFGFDCITSKYPPAEPGALVCEPLKAANQGR